MAARDAAPERPQRAYQLRMNSDRTWETVALILGYSRATAAREAARRYALRERLPWPPPGSRPRGRARTDLARARQAYELAATTKMAWREIASELGYSQAHQGRAALMMARRYAARAGRPWPIGPNSA